MMYSPGLTTCTIPCTCDPSSARHSAVLADVNLNTAAAWQACCRGRSSMAAGAANNAIPATPGSGYTTGPTTATGSTPASTLAAPTAWRGTAALAANSAPATTAIGSGAPAAGALTTTAAANGALAVAVNATTFFCRLCAPIGSLLDLDVPICEQHWHVGSARSYKCARLIMTDHILCHCWCWIQPAWHPQTTAAAKRTRRRRHACCWRLDV